MSFKRAELRRQAKNAESANKSVCFKSMDEYKKVIQMNAERMAHQMFIDNADFAYKLNYRMMEIAVQIAYRSVTSHVGTKRMNRFMDHVYKNFKEISNVFTHDSDAEIGRWCEINNVDADYFFGIKKKYIDPFPVRDEDGRPVIYLEVEE